MAFRFDSLPIEVRSRILPFIDKKRELLDGIGRLIAQKRDEAKAARVANNAEYIWRACEEAYEGIDDANRGMYPTARWSKSMSIDGPVDTGEQRPMPSKRSTVFIPMTARYVEAASAKLGEILLPAGEKSFSIKPTPVPELIEMAKSNKVIIEDGSMGVGEIGQPWMRPAAPGESPVAAPGQPGAAPGAPPAVSGLPAGGASQMVPVTEGDIAKDKMEIANKAAAKAETRIFDWMVQCDHQAEVRKVIFDGARLGTGVLLGPDPQLKTAKSITEREDGGFNVEIVHEVIPGTKWIDVWNFFPDPSCGEDVHAGSHCFRREYLTEDALIKLAQEPGYIESQINKVIQEGPDKNKARARQEGKPGPQGGVNDKRYEVWFFHGVIKRSELACICVNAGQPLEDEDIPLSRRYVPVVVTLVNDSVIKAAVNPLESGKFPYRVFRWQRRVGVWFGKGISEQLDASQRILNGAYRAMLDNLGKSAGSQVVVNRFAVEPADQDWEVVPDKLWYVTEEGMGLDVRQIFMVADLPNQTDPMIKVIQLAMQSAEESTSIPLVTQGQSGKTTPETFGATKLQDTNANQLLRSLGYEFDDSITDPLVTDYYEVLLLDPDIPDDEKGDFFIDARGSSALVERAIQDQTVAQMGVMVLNPAYKGDPAKWFEEFLLSHKFNPDKFKYSQQQLDEMAKQPPPEDPTVAAAKVRAEVEKAKIEAEAKVAEARANADAELQKARIDLEREKLALERERIGVESSLEIQKLDIQRDLEVMRSAREQGVSIEKIKADLAKTAMTLAAQERLQDKQAGHDDRREERKQAGKPRRRVRPQRPPQGAEPRGRAENGQAFVQ